MHEEESARSSDGALIERQAEDDHESRTQEAQSANGESQREPLAEEKGVSYNAFLRAKLHEGADSGFDPLWMPESLFPFQRSLTEWALIKGRAALWEDCGLGKTRQQLTWAKNVLLKTGRPVLVLTPLAVSFQTVQEGEKIGLEITQRREGKKTGDGLVVTNYERLHNFEASDFAAVVCDESSILKNADGATRQAVTDFMRKVRYRLLCTATAAPNDYLEIGTSSEALGEMGFNDMLGRFFKKIEKTLSRKDEHRGGVYRFRGHAEKHFWRWICSWARAVRKPSDLGFDDGAFKLPALNVREHIVTAKTKAAGFLFDLPASDLREQREELRRSLPERCEMAADLINAHDRPAIAWCHLNSESEVLSKAIRGAQEVSGDDADERKEEIFTGFVRGEIRALVTKPKIGALGLNFQHCAHQTYFPSHSYEQYYQGVRRSWRFGQKNDVTIDVISTEGQAGVLANLQRKTAAADRMFDQLIGHMRDELKISQDRKPTTTTVLPSWL